MRTSTSFHKKVHKRHAELDSASSQRNVDFSLDSLFPGRPRYCVFRAQRVRILSGALLSALILSAGCAPPYTALTIGRADRYPGAASLSMTGPSLREGIVYLTRAFGDTLDEPVEQLWEEQVRRRAAAMASSAEPGMDNLDIALSLLRGFGYTVFSLSPSSCEAVHAISGLPIAVWVLMLDLPGGKVQPLTTTDLGASMKTLLSPRADRISLHLLASTTPMKQLCELATHDGIRWKNGTTDRLEGPLSAVETAHGSGYRQIVAHIGIAKVSLREINAYLDEWFKNLPYTYGKVTATEVR